MSQGDGVEVELEFLSALERGEVVSQQTLSRRVGISVGLINALLKRAVRKGYVKVQSAPAKRWAYYLTPGGALEKGRLVAEFLESSFGLFRKARSEYETIFRRAAASGHTRILLAGAGDLADVAVLAACDSEVTLVGVLAPECNRPRRAGLTVVRSIDEAGQFHVVVVSDMRRPQQTYDDLVGQLGRERVVAPNFLRVSSEAPKFPRLRNGTKP